MTAPVRHRPRPTAPTQGKAPARKAGESNLACTIMLIIGSAIVGMLVLGAIIASSEQGPANVTTPVAAPVVPASDPVDDQLAALDRDLQRRIAENDAEVNSKPRTYVTDGTWEVGSQPGQMRPGTYRTTGSDCYWARSSDATGDTDSILANGFANGPTVVTVKASDATFSASGGCMWSRKN